MPLQKRSAGKVRRFSWPTRGELRRPYTSASAFQPTAQATIDEIKSRFDANEKAKERKTNDQAAALSAAIHARRTGERDLPDPGEITVEEGHKGQKYWDFGH